MTLIIKRLIKKVSTDSIGVPLVLLGICTISFGLLIPWLGFYWDDWWTIKVVHDFGDPSSLYYYTYRPLHAFTDVLTMSVLGTTPIYWHILSLVARWLAGCGVWLVFEKVWPERHEQNIWIAILFIVYPVFLKQSMAVIFRQHWITYIFFLISLFFMLNANEDRSKMWVNTGIAIISMITHLLLTEYLVGLEIIRPVLLWVQSARFDTNNSKRMRLVLKRWSPYLLVWVAFIIWRLFIVEIPEDPNPPVFLYAFLDHPIAALIDFLQLTLPDLLYVTVTSWYQTLQPDLINFNNAFDLFSLGMSAMVGIAIFFIVRYIAPPSESSEGAQKWSNSTIWIGLLAILVSLIPIWITGRNVLGGLYDDRLSIPALLGTSILFVGLITFFINSRYQRFLILSAMIGLAVGSQLREGNLFRWNWINQDRFYWQIYWRAPDFEPNTPIIMDGAITQYASRYVASFAINTFYEMEPVNGQYPLWVFEQRYNIKQVDKNRLKDEFYNFKFSSNIHDAVVLMTPSQEGNCVWFLTELDAINPLISNDMQTFASSSNISRILPVSRDMSYPPMNIFGPEPDHSWCYYYQKADLARQLGDWDLVISLGNEANELGYKPQSGYEYIPFIQAHAELGQWEQAKDLTLLANERTEEISSMLCHIWGEYEQDNNTDQGFMNAWLNIDQTLSCSSPP